MKKIIFALEAAFFIWVVILTISLMFPHSGYSDFTSQDVSGDLVVTDNRTGLMWEVKTAANKGIQYNWYNACLYCSNLTFAGHDDWRLPTIKELASIVDSDKAAGTAIDTTYFPNCQSYYWSSTTFAPIDSEAWVVKFGSFPDGVKDKAVFGGYVRCVR